MKFYFAPMEGVTKYLYREAFNIYFGNIDKYFTPFISPDKNTCLNKKELNDILPEHNQGMYVVPQILTNDADDFIMTACELKKYGYNEVNLNLGCPSGTVVSKKRGSGFLKETKVLDEFLDRIFSGLDMKISVKTRIGKDSPDEFDELIEIYNKYPMDELIVHPRIQRDFYRNTPNLKAFADAVKKSKNPLCYNGDIFTAEDFNRIRGMFPEIDMYMLGRGLIANPGLINFIKSGDIPDNQTVKQFHDKVLDGYKKLMFDEKNIMFKMKEFSLYLVHIFSNNEAYIRRIKKSKTLAEYKAAMNSLFIEQEIVPGAGFIPPA